MTSSKKPLDPVVKIGLGVLIGAFCLIALGMFLSRPDRSIPPFSVGSHEGMVVAIHLPPWTSDQDISRLIERFRQIGRETRDFARMKIQPTTPKDSRGRYRRLLILLFTDHSWTEPTVLHRYLESLSSPDDQRFRTDFESSIRGGYLLTDHEAKGWLGPATLKEPEDPIPRNAWLFVERLGQSRTGTKALERAVRARS